ncbi:VF530 family protein [Jeongeupia wiesaeckerbachi]|uniref:VF530 family protein n=1 Tax=Jeongeupia wiesaeckerbachi TaxID=3051218 RepID=UPI003D80565E
MHGITLERMLTDLVDYWGWDELARQIPLNCFKHEPSIKSSLSFLRRTPWARTEVEGFYAYCLRHYSANARR